MSARDTSWKKSKEEMMIPHMDELPVSLFVELDEPFIMA